MKRVLTVSLAAAAIAAVSAPAQAQTVTSSAGTTSQTASIVYDVTGNMMGGMKVTAKFSGQSAISGFWGDLGGGFWGVMFGRFGSISVGSLVNTFSSASPASNVPGPWKLSISTPADIDYLDFEGGQFGGVLFDRRCSNQIASTNNCTSFGNGTAGSSLGNDFDLTGNSFANAYNTTTAAYTNGVGLGFAAPVGDLFTKVSLDFTAYQGGPDNQQSPIEFFLDTDIGSFPAPNNVVPEPSTYALMAAGLAALGVVARRRRNGNIA